MNEKVLISKDGLRQALGLKGLVGKCVAGALYRILGIGKLNKVYPYVADLEGPDFSEEVLRRFGISYEVPEEQLGNIPSEGGFLTVSNHPFGGADGLILNAIINSRREDFKILTTFLLAKVSNLTKWFIPVDNFSKGGAKSITGIRTALGHIASGGSLGLFPTGEVSTYQKKGRRTALRQAQGPCGKRVIEDKPWPENISKLIKNSGLPVIPIYFDGTNSRIFHILGMIHPRLRTLRLVRELTCKNGTLVKVRIGKAISASEIAGMDIQTLGNYLRNRTYALEAQCVPEQKESEGIKMTPLIEPVDQDLVRSQMSGLEDKCLFQAGDYKGYLIDASDAPDAMKELYRLREETFRAIGEGTGNPYDTDSYDGHYKHLILWNIPNGEIAGAYRVGFGSRIIPALGKDGLYTASLLRFGPDSDRILPHSMELGRSFLSLKYQREVLPLKLMLSGLAVAMATDPQANYSIGTVSISNALPDFYKSLAIYFLERDFLMENADSFATAPNPFHPDFLRVNPDGLLSKIPKGDIDAFDRLLAAISDGKYRLPVLFRKYFSCGAKVSCFNVDPSFNNCLDGMIVLNKSDFPVGMTRSLVRPLPKETGEMVFRHFYGTLNPE
ncbi:MAG: lysophospholipid acyltransferase family protein [Bacteroidales bacterium]|nr:lysophospholipid acyltransferase family protein [Bacteroidales bacterium]